MTIESATATRLEKAAADSGFDRPTGEAQDWLAFQSSHAPLQVWLRGEAGGRVRVAFSRSDVAGALAEAQGTSGDLPAGADAACVVVGIPAVHSLLRRSYQLAKSLPDELLHVFEDRTATLPRATEVERLVIQRIGQDVFRQGLIDYWDGRCAITGLAVPELLRASHIKPWAACETDAERLDVFNGLLLAPQLDATFDSGLMTLTDDGQVVVSARLDAGARALLGLDEPLRARGLQDGHRRYLAWHREREFGVPETPGDRRTGQAAEGGA